MAKDYYSILGIDRKASKDEIKSAFRKLAHKYHPDKNQGNKEAEDKFKEINEAYQVLSDEKKRAQYDQFGSEGPMGGGGFNYGGFGGFDASSFEGFDFGNVGDIFSDFFGGGFGGGARARRGSDIEVQIDITLKDSFFGIHKSFTINRTKECIVCDGTGSKKATEFDTCKDCGGKGSKVEIKRTILGSMQTQVVCGTCNGKGKVPKEKCSSCKGKGIDYGRDEISFAIPAGIQQGAVITIPKKGEAILGGITGDLYVRVNILEDKNWKRVGLDLVHRLDVKLTDAILGNTISIETWNGQHKVTIPSGSQTTDSITERGKGFVVGGRKGDLKIILNVVIPKKLSGKAKKLIEEMQLEGY